MKELDFLFNQVLFLWLYIKKNFFFSSKKIVHSYNNYFLQEVAKCQAEP